MRLKHGKTADQIASEIHCELRRILEIRRDLYAPINSFEPAPPRDGMPRFFVLFDQHQRVRFAQGLKLGGIRTLSVPDERISARYFDFVLGVWHLKDRIHQYAKVTRSVVDIKALEDSTVNLRVCADLANWKKHGAYENRSGLSPYLSEVKFDTSRSGPIELYYDGVMKRKGLIVAYAVPIPFTVDILTGADRRVVGDAREIINSAFVAWNPILEKLGLLAQENPVGMALRGILFE